MVNHGWKVEITGFLKIRKTKFAVLGLINWKDRPVIKMGQAAEDSEFW